MSEVIVCKYKDWMGWINVYDHFTRTLTIISPFGTRRINGAQKCQSKKCKFAKMTAVLIIQ